MRKKFFSRSITFILALFIFICAMPNQQVKAYYYVDYPIYVGVYDESRPTIVKFAGHYWQTIGCDGYGIASDYDTITLLAKDYDFGMSRFDSYNNKYLGLIDSDLLEKMDHAYRWDLNYNRNMILSTTLTGGSANYDSYYYDSDCTAGNNVYNAKLWPLSVYESEIINPCVRSFTYDYWLRTPGDSNYKAAFTTCDGQIERRGYKVTESDFAIRPACIVNLIGASLYMSGGILYIN